MKRSLSGATLVTATFGLTLAVITLVMRDSAAVTRDDEKIHEFQELVGGLGIGPTATLANCQFSFDPRLYPEWRCAHDPMICGEYFCPRHASAVFYLPPLKRETGASSHPPTSNPQHHANFP